MITIYDSIESFCYEHKLETPNHKHCGIIGIRVMRKAIEQYQNGDTKRFLKIPKVEKTFKWMVNEYPAEFSPLINLVIKEYFADKTKFFNQENQDVAKMLKYLNFDIESICEKEFEAAAKEVKIKISMNGTTKGKTQYKLSFRINADLILLGVAFGKKLNEIKKVVKPRKRIAVKND